MKQNTTQEKYNLLIEGKSSSVDFLKSVKKDYPQFITNSTNLEDAKTILKNRGVINENYIDLTPIGNYESKKEESYETAFKNFLKEEVQEKAEEKKVSKNVEAIQAKNFDPTDKKSITNVSFQQFLLGTYAECKDPKNESKTLDEVKEIVEKKLAKDPLHYVKNNLHGVDGIGLEEMMATVEAKGKYASSGYGDLDKDTKALIKEGLFSKKPEPKDGEVQDRKRGFIEKMLISGDKQWQNNIINPPTQFIEKLVEYSKSCGYFFYDAQERTQDAFSGPAWEKWRTIYCCTEQSIKNNTNVWIYEKNNLYFNRKGLDAKTNQWILDNSPKKLNESKFDINIISKFNVSLMESIADSDSFENESPRINSKKIERLVDSVNSLIERAVDEDGDAIPVIDNSGTWESPTLYEPIMYDGKYLTIISRELYKDKKNEDIISNENMEFDGIPTLQLIARLYKKAMKQEGINEEETFANLEDINEANAGVTGLIVRVSMDDIKSFEAWLDQSQFFAENEGRGEYFFPEEEANYDNLEKFLSIDMAAEDIEAEFEGVFPKSVVHENLINENKKMNLQKRLKEIEKTGAVAALEAKIGAIQEEIDSRQDKINTVSENEALSDFVNKDQIKVIEKEIKELTKHKAKLEKLQERANGGKKVKAPAEVIDEDPEEGGDSVDEIVRNIPDDTYIGDESWFQDYEGEDYDEDEDFDMSDDDLDSLYDEVMGEEDSIEGSDYDSYNRINEGYTTGDKIDFLSQIRYPNPQDRVEFSELDKLSGKTVQKLFESYFPEKAKK